MSNTLKLLAGNLSAVAVRLGPALGPKGALVAAVLSIAVAQPVLAQSSANQNQNPNGLLGVSNQTIKIAGQAAGGVGGYLVGNAMGFSGIGKGLTAVAGAFAGGAMVDAIQGNQDKKLQDKSVSVLIDELGSNPRGDSRLKTLPTDVNERMRGMVVDTASHRQIAQEKYATFSTSEMDAATNPGDAKARDQLKQDRIQFENSMRSFRASLSNLNGAIRVAGSRGYSMDEYAAVSRKLSAPVDEANAIHVDHPAVSEKVAVLRERSADEAIAVAQARSSPVGAEPTISMAQMSAAAQIERARAEQREASQRRSLRNSTAASAP